MVELEGYCEGGGELLGDIMRRDRTDERGTVRTDVR